MKEDNNIINLLQVNEFTEAHLNIFKVNKLVNWRKVYPELFVKVPGAPAIAFDDFELMPHTQFPVTHQKHRAGGRTRKAKYKAIKQNIERNGWKLKYPPIAVFIWDDGTVEIITGNTRTEILRSSPFDTENAIVAVYRAASSKYSVEQIRDSLDVAGSSFNSIHDPAEPVQPQDVKRSVMRAVHRYKTSNGTAGIPATLEAIEQRIDFHCGEGVFQPTTRKQLCFEIYSIQNPDSVIISWSNGKDKDFNIHDFMKRAKLVDTDKIKWLVTATESHTKAFAKAQRLAVQNPNCEIRIIMHTATLGGNCLLTTYQNRCSTFVDRFYSIQRDVCVHLFKKEVPDYNRVKIWGALPALGEFHNITKPMIYNSRTQTFYQDGEDYEFDVYDEFEDLDEAA